jgi:hypothetical protein
MAKISVVSGFACPAHPWENFLSSMGTPEVITLASLFTSAAPGTSFKALAQVAADRLSAQKPELVVAHDFGVTIAILALLKARQRNPEFQPKVILFNGALRGFRLHQAPHPLWAQVWSTKQIVESVQQAGGEFDPALGVHLPRVRALYRDVIGLSLLDQIQSIFRAQRPLNLILGSSVSILASANDPYIPRAAIERLAADLCGSTLEWFEYGHFPYSGVTAREGMS